MLPLYMVQIIFLLPCVWFYRDPECLSLFAAIINKLGQEMMDTIPKIFQAVFDCTLQMITKDFESYPEHRVQVKA